jgi:archaeosine-15-forming tRNA-guanine transglycosylase
MCKTHIFQQLAKNEKFKGSIGHSTVLVLSARAKHNLLFLTTQRNKRVSKKETKTSSRVTVSRIRPNQHQNKHKGQEWSELRSENHEALCP